MTPGPRIRAGDTETHVHEREFRLAKDNALKWALATLATIILGVGGLIWKTQLAVLDA